jgi:hypothetical protein
MKHIRHGKGIFDRMLTRATAMEPPRIFWSSPDVSPQNQADIDAQIARDAALEQSSEDA